MIPTERRARSQPIPPSLSSGAEDPAAPPRELCDDCEGRGSWRETFETFHGYTMRDVPVTCGSCEGTGLRST
jgi:DnaJ-class molecular chaperone